MAMVISPVPPAETAPRFGPVPCGPAGRVHFSVVPAVPLSAVQVPFKFGISTPLIVTAPEPETVNTLPAVSPWATVVVIVSVRPLYDTATVNGLVTVIAAAPFEPLPPVSGQFG